MIKEIPMLYSTPMVQSIGLDRKTKTRRTKGLEGAELVQQSIHNPLYFGISRNGTFEEITCPYGRPGDVLWVRESFQYRYGDKNQVVYKADLSYAASNVVSWKPSIHMPKAAARYWLQITDIHVERLKDITEEDAIAEGVEPIADGYKNYAMLPKIISTLHCWDTARMSFFSLWESINGVGSIEKNP